MTIHVRNGRVDIDVPSDDNARQCARLLKEHPSSIKSIDLSKGVMTSAGAGVIAKALKGNTSLKHLGLHGNAVGDAGVGYIGKSIESNLGCALTSLDLSATGMTVLGLSSLVQGVCKLPGLHTICLSDNNLTQEAGHQLSNLFKSSSSLHTLVACGNYLGDRGVAALSGAFCYLNPARVISLDVSGNGIGDLGVQWLCRGISTLCHTQIQSDNLAENARRGGGGAWGGVRIFRVRDNNITHQGAVDLANLLSEEQCARELRELDVSMNTITADGFRPLARSFRGCRELARLDVAGCRLGPGGLEAAAELIASAGSKLSAVDLTPKAEFADRVLGDRGGLAVALRQSLQRLADSLRFASTVVELKLGAFVRADPVAAASIQETLQEHRERLGELTASISPSVAGPGRGGNESGKRDTAKTASRSSEKLRSSGTTRAGGVQNPNAPSRGSRTRGAATGTGTPPSGTRRGTPIQRPAAASARGAGVERPRAGPERVKTASERSKPSAVERTKRAAESGAQGRAPSGGSSVTSPRPPPSSLQRPASKASSRAARGGVRAEAALPVSARRAGQGAAQRGTVKTTSATLAAHDKAADAARPAAARRLHQGEELDSIDGFSFPHSRAMAPSTREDGTTRRKGNDAEKIADMVSKVMGDTEGIAHDMSPPPVAPSSRHSREDEGEKYEQGFTDSRSSSGKIPLPPDSDAGKAVAPVGREKAQESRDNEFVRESSVSGTGDHEEPELSAGMVSLSLNERRPRSDSRSQEIAMELSNASGGQQLVTVAEAGRMLSPLVAREVKQETRKIEIRLQNEMSKALSAMRSDMERIDREALMARVAMERRIKTSLKRLVERFVNIERRFARLERGVDHNKRIAGLDAGGSPAPLAEGGSRRAALPPPQESTLNDQPEEALSIGDLAARRANKRIGFAGASSGVVTSASGVSAVSDPVLAIPTASKAWMGECGGGLSALMSASQTVASDEEFQDSGDEAEADIVRMLEEKMSALEGKLLGHEERQRGEHRAGGEVTAVIKLRADQGFDQRSPVRA